MSENVYFALKEILQICRILDRSYWAFKDHFPDQAEVLLNSLDATYKRSLMSLSNSGSINSLNSAVSRTTNSSPRQSRLGITSGAGTVNNPLNSNHLSSSHHSSKLYDQIIPKRNKKKPFVLVLFSISMLHANKIEITKKYRTKMNK